MLAKRVCHSAPTVLFTVASAAMALPSHAVLSVGISRRGLQAPLVRSVGFGLMVTLEPTGKAACRVGHLLRAVGTLDTTRYIAQTPIFSIRCGVVVHALIHTYVGVVRVTR